MFIRALFYLLLLVCFFSFLSPLSWAKDSSEKDNEYAGGLIYGEGYSYLLKAPLGWTLDNQSGREQGIAAVLYPKGSSWADSPTVMYSRVVAKEGRSLEKVIQSDIEYMQKSSPQIKSSIEPDIAYGAKDKKATLRYLSADRNGNVEAVAYLEESNWVILIVLSARSEAEFEKSLPSFKDLVKEFSYFTDSVEIKE